MIVVGTKDTPLDVDPQRLVGGCALVTGTRGSGKSFLARVIVEQTIPLGLQTIVLDPEGEFATLRERCNILIAGPDGDVPVDPRSAGLLARRIAELGCSAVVDLSGLGPDDQAAAVGGFVSALDRLPKAHERSRLIVLDEAHRFCPESGKGKSVASEPVVLLMSQGRKRGLGAILVTQRLSKLRKDAAAEAATIFVFRTSPIDIPRAQDLLGVSAPLRSLEPGTCYATGRALVPDDVDRVIRVRRAETTHPEPGTRWKTAPPPPSSAIRKLLAELRDLPPSPAEEEASDLEAAKRRIAELEHQIAATPVVKEVDGTAILLAVAERDREWEAALDTWRHDTAEVVKDATGRIVTCVREALYGFASKSPAIDAARRGMDAAPSAPTAPVKQVRTARESAPTTPRNGAHVPGGKGRAMLTALAQRSPMAKRQLALVVCMSSEGGGFRNYLGEGKASGIWTVDGDEVAITSAGKIAAGPVPPMPRGHALVEHWCQHPKLGGKARAMLRLIADAGPRGLDVESLARAVGMEASGGGFRNYLGTMRTLDLITGTRTLVAAEELRR